MNDDAVLRFLPWMRRGIARAIVGVTNEHGMPASSRGTIKAVVSIGNEDVERSFQIRGPGSVIGLSRTQIVREYPPGGTTDFETNHFPAIELASPDLPWAFTPTPPYEPGDLEKTRLIPWLVLVVVEDRELEQSSSAPLPLISVDASELPNLEEAWAWAHVQATTNDESTQDVNHAFSTRPEAFVARLVCPRRLDPDTRYLACLVPAFNAGVNAGRGLTIDPDDVEPAWNSNSGQRDLPVYHSWRFQTSSVKGDFETLVRRLDPVTLEASVGLHELDITKPGVFTLTLFLFSVESPTQDDIDQLNASDNQDVPSVLSSEFANNGIPLSEPSKEVVTAGSEWRIQDDAGNFVVKYENENETFEVYQLVYFRGALVSPNAPDLTLGPDNFSEEVRPLLPSVLFSLESPTEDDIADLDDSTLPLVLEQAFADHHIALPQDPPVTVVTEGNEWQISNGTDAFRVEKQNGTVSIYALVDDPAVAPPAYGLLPADANLIPLEGDEPTWLSHVNLTAAHRATAGLGAEVVRRNQESLLAEAWEQAANLREVNRILNQTRLAFEVGRRFKSRVDRMDDGTLLQFSRGAHARLRPADGQKTVYGRIAESVLPDGLVSAAFRRRVRRGTTVAPTSEDSLAAQVTDHFVRQPSVALDFAKFSVSPAATFAASQRELAQEIEKAGGDINDIIRILKTRPNVKIDELESASARSSTEVSSGADASSLTELAGVIRQTLDPAPVLKKRLQSMIQIEAPTAAIREEFEEMWRKDSLPASMLVFPTYPKYTFPAYELLVRISPELLMPGVGALQDDTVSLAEVNWSFVEAFLLGANHELSREFMWREYPANLADTWLRRFWDYVDDDTEDADQETEDIPPMANWDDGALGTHATFAAQANSDSEGAFLALLIKGALLRRYPSTLIYAVPATWQEPDETEEESNSKVYGISNKPVRVEVEDRNLAVHPIFTGSLGRDVVFLGFQLPVDIDEVSGDPDSNNDNPGWFFVFEQPPGEPSFGLDEEDKDEAPELWKDLRWKYVLGSSGSLHVPIENELMNGLTLPYDSNTDNEEDETGITQNTWSETWGTNAAAMARITLQRPVRMLVHADQMLEDQDEDGHGDGT